jgi:NAD(P)-dependent dehydrogenase (short-subunit alcohol dehydrogenase family)
MAAASALAEMHANLILVGRNQQVGDSVARRLAKRSPQSMIAFIRADLSKPDDVRELAGVIAKQWAHVDVLINNAGARFRTYHENPEGIELTFATNHLGHFLLTRLLLDHLVKAPAGRIVTVTSGVHFSAPPGVWYMGRDNYDGAIAYAKSKLANLMFAYELARRLERSQVTSNALHPGVVATNFERNNGLMVWLRYLVGHARKRRLVSPKKGAETVVFLAASQDVAGVTGKYFVRKQQVESSPESHDRAEARRLWELSNRLTGLTTDVGEGL